MQSYKLGELVTFNYGKSLPKRNRIEGDFPVMSSAGITGYHNEALIDGPGVIVGRKGSIGTVYYEERNFYPIDTCFYLTINNEEKLDLKYLYYMLTQSNLKDLNSDAAVPGLNRDIACAQYFEVPDLIVQRSIVFILEGYDNLIENNNRRIAILEDVAQSLYREWFVKFRFPDHEKVKFKDSPLGKIPEEWDVKALKNVLELAYGKALKKGERKGGAIAVYGSGGLGGFHDKALVAGPVIIVGRKGNVGKVFWVEEDCWPIDTVFYVKSGLSKYYLYYNLLHQSFYNSDAAVPGLNRESAYSNKFIEPSIDILNQFDTYMKGIFEQLRVLRKKNANLKSQRDMVLPKLISGNISI